MESEFVALDKWGKRLNGFGNSQKIFQDERNLYQQYAYNVIANLLLEGHRAICIMVSQDAFADDTIPLNNYSQKELSLFIR